MTFKEDDYHAALRSLDRASANMQTAITMPHATKDELDCKLIAVLDAYHIMLVQQSKFKLWTAKHGLTLDAYYRHLEQA